MTMQKITVANFSTTNFFTFKHNWLEQTLKFQYFLIDSKIKPKCDNCQWIYPFCIKKDIQNLKFMKFSKNRA